MVGVSDARGAQTDALLTANGKTSTTDTCSHCSISMYRGRSESAHQAHSLWREGRRRGEAKRTIQRNLRVAILWCSAGSRAGVRKTTHLTVQGDWPSPGFDGGFLPVTRQVSSHGFTAEWSVPFIARSVRAEGTGDSITGLNATRSVSPSSKWQIPYQSVDRSLKYVALFLGLIFLSYFVFEVTTGKRVHPAQYVLVGIAQIIFYLLLLSLAERIGFDLSFMLAGAATVALLSANAGWVFASRLQGLRATAIFTLLYALIYLLLRLEDNALLVGAITSFLAVAAAMYFTRRIDWYSSLTPGQETHGSAVGR